MTEEPWNKHTPGDPIAADPYNALEWDEDSIALAAMDTPKGGGDA